MNLQSLVAIIHTMPPSEHNSRRPDHPFTCTHTGHFVPVTKSAVNVRTRNADTSKRFIYADFFTMPLSLAPPSNGNGRHPVEKCIHFPWIS